MSLVGSTLGKYQVLEELGRGGMAVVYRGYNPALQRTVALKVMKPELAADLGFVARFCQEAQTAAQLKHPNIATIYDVEQAGETYFIVMEYLPGTTLQQQIRTHGAPSLDRAVEIVSALASALDYAHQRGLIHRDVKPSNVMVGPDGHVTLMDFGIVKAAAGLQLTREGTRIGTPEYMSPEQALGQEVDARSDIYSLGVVLYELLVGNVPFHSTSSNKVLDDHVRREPPPPSTLVKDLPPGVERVVLRALAKRPKQRFRSAGQLAAALEQAAALAPSRAGRPPLSASPGPAGPPIGLKLVASDGAEFPLSGVVGLGRSADNQVVISDGRISRQHAQVRWQGARCEIVDLGSVNGTFVNDERLRPNVPHPLRPGDRLRLGPEHSFTVEAVATADKTVHRPPRGTDPNAKRRPTAPHRSRSLFFLVAGIGLLLLALIAVAVAVMQDRPRATSPAGWAEVTFVNDTGQALELRILSQRWSMPAGGQRTLTIPAGDYDYWVALEDGSLLREHGAWDPGERSRLYLVRGQP